MDYSNSYIEFVNGFARVRRAGFWGFINEAGVEVVPCIYSTLSNYGAPVWYIKRPYKPTHKYAVGIKDNVVYLIDREGKAVIFK